MKNSKIQYVRDFKTGLEFKSNDLLLKYENDPRERTQIRRELYGATKEGNEKTLVCSVCNQSLGLYGGKGKTKQILHFRHYQDSSDCPIKTSENLSQKEIDCIRYNGAKESERHKQLKEFIYNRLLQDDRFKESAMEKVVKILNEKKSWRKPDVSAVFEDKKIVFEIQLQTTFLNVIVDRENDYKNEQTYIMWFFDNSNMEKFRFSEEDIFYANNSNAFVITDKTIELSLQENKFLFECCYKKQYIKENMIIEKWENEIISFDDLKFDIINYKVHYHNFDEAKERLKEELDKSHIENSLMLLEQCDIDEYQIFQNALRTLFEKYGAINKKNLISSKVIRTIFILYSVKKQKVYGWDNKDIIWALNNFFHHHEEYSFLVMRIIIANNLGDDLIVEDKNKSFKTKVDQWKKRDKNKDETKYNGLFIELFPELKKVEK
jgi:hypothetical protein